MRPEFLFTLAIDPRRVWRALRNWRWNRKGRRLTKRAQVRIGEWRTVQRRLEQSTCSGLGRPSAAPAEAPSRPLS